MATTLTHQVSKQAGARPPFPAQEQQPPGSDQEMRPKASTLR